MRNSRLPVLWRGEWRRDLPGAKAGEAGKFRRSGREERKIILRMFEKAIRNHVVLCLSKITCIYVFLYIDRSYATYGDKTPLKSLDFLIETPVPDVVWIGMGPICSCVWIVGPSSWNFWGRFKRYGLVEGGVTGSWLWGLKTQARPLFSLFHSQQLENQMWALCYFSSHVCLPMSWWRLTLWYGIECFLL